MKDLAGLGHLFVCVFLYCLAALMVVPAITDVTMEALCPGTDQCSLAIYLNGLQHSITGMGNLIVTPFIGNLSDRYGRKALLTLPMTVQIFPLAILAYSRRKAVFLVYFVVRTLASVFDGGMICLPIAYVADQVGEQRRATAIGFLSGVALAGSVSGTLISRFLPTALTFPVSATVAASAAVYMRVFLVDSRRTAADAFGASQPILEADALGQPPLLPSSKGPSLWDMIGFLRSSVTFSRAAILSFLICFGEGGLYVSQLYYLKARFHFNKDQFADLLLIIATTGAVSQLFLMPILVTTIGEEKLLSIALLASCTNIFFYSIAWASWVPYFTCMFVAVSIFSQPCIRSVISKKVKSNEQGTAQGCMSGVISFANILSPIVFTPLTALFLSESAPFYFPGFSLLCAGFVSMAAFIQSITMTMSEPTVCCHKFRNTGDVQP